MHLTNQGVSSAAGLHAVAVACERKPPRRRGAEQQETGASSQMVFAVMQRSLLLLVRPVAARHSCAPRRRLGTVLLGGSWAAAATLADGPTVEACAGEYRRRCALRVRRATRDEVEQPRTLASVARPACMKKGHLVTPLAAPGRRLAPAATTSPPDAPGAAFGWQSTPWWRQTIRSPAPRSSPRRTSRRRCSRRAGCWRTLSMAPWKAPSRRASTTRAATCVAEAAAARAARRERGAARRRGAALVAAAAPRRAARTQRRAARLRPERQESALPSWGG